MRIAHFRHLLETRGPDLSQWPEPWAEAARQLVVANPAAARELEAMRRLEGLIVAHMERGPDDPNATIRMMNALRGPLPAQRSNWMTAWLPTVLLTFDLTPSWPRVAALAAIAGIGFMIGLSEPGLIGGRGTTSASADADLSLIVFEADPLPSMRPL